MIEESTKLIQPRAHKAKVSIWKDLTVADLDRLEHVTNPDQIKQLLCEILHIENPDLNPKNHVLLDLYYYTLAFAKQQEFSKEQTSAFFTIVKNTHEICTETPFGNVRQCFDYMQQMALCHAVRRPPFSIDLFTPNQVKNLTAHIINTYFRHFKLYKYVFTPLVRLDLSMTYNGMPATPEPAEDEQAAAGDEDGEEKQDEPEKQDETETQENAQDEESPAASELRKLIRQHLAEELKTLKVSVDDKLKETETTMNKLLEKSEGSSSGAKGGRASAKSRKK